MPAKTNPRAPGSGSLARPLSIVLIGLCALMYWSGGGSLEAIRAIDQLMIRVAAVFFSLVFTAPELRRLFPGKLTASLVAHRSDMAVSFAVAFVLHLCAISGFYALDPELFRSVSPPLTEILRGIGLGFILLMLIDTQTRRLTAGWQRVNIFGGYYVWAAFLNGFAKRIAINRFYLVPAVFLILVVLLKLAGLWVRAPHRSTAQ